MQFECSMFWYSLQETNTWLWTVDTLQGSVDTWNNQNWTIMITWDNHYSLFCVKGLNEDSFLVFQILLVYFALFPNQLSWIVPVARITHSFKILIKERDENQLLKKTSLLLQSSILVTQSKAEEKKFFFESLSPPYFFPH